MGLIAFFTPIIIPAWGWFLFGIEWQNSLSAYYFAPDGDNFDKFSPYPCRVLFVGVLFALGSFLFMYKGFSWWENKFLNFAGAFAVGVALFPMFPQPGYFPFFDGLHLHYTFALLLFACMACTVIFCYRSTLRWIADKNVRARYRSTYRVIAGLMVFFPLVAVVLAELSGGLQRYIFWAELAGIWTFAAYWFTKSLELSNSEGELKLLLATLTPSLQR